MTERAPGKPRIVGDRLLRELAREYGTPLYVYDAATIRRQVAELRGFDLVRYAQKANSNLQILRLLRGLGVHVDAVSAGEVYRARRAGFADSEIQFTADIFDRFALDLLARHPVHVNAGSADMIEQLAAIRPGTDLTLRINPGFGHGHDPKVSTGGAESKHGIWYQQLPAVLERVERAGLRTTGLHVHIGSGSDFDNLSRIRDSLAQAALAAGGALKTLSAGGGIPIPYRPGEPAFDTARYAADWRQTQRSLEAQLGRRLVLEVEPGRYLVGAAGLLVAEVRATKNSGGIDYLLVDAGLDNLVRPAMYGAYHHLSIIGRDHEPQAPRMVAGPLCESADIFTQKPGGTIEPRLLPAATVGDLLCIHDAGAYAASMASNYNSRCYAAEVLVDGGDARLIRRRQTLDQLVALEEDLELAAPNRRDR